VFGRIEWVAGWCDGDYSADSPDENPLGPATGELRARPLPFSATKAFFPSYDAEERVTVYAILGGVPAYLEGFSDALSLSDNIRQNLFRDIGLFRTDPDYLIGEQARDLKNHQAVLTAIAEGARQPADISRKERHQ
jgi:hypothetical protein